MKLMKLFVATCLFIGAFTTQASALTMTDLGATWQEKLPKLHIANPLHDNSFRWEYTIYTENTSNNPHAPQCIFHELSDTNISTMNAARMFDFIAKIMKDNPKNCQVSLEKLTAKSTSSNQHCDFLQHNNLSHFNNDQVITLNPESCTAT